VQDHYNSHNYSKVYHEDFDNQDDHFVQDHGQANAQADDDEALWMGLVKMGR
jgi:hypothetical protein